MIKLLVFSIQYSFFLLLPQYLLRPFIHVQNITGFYLLKFPSNSGVKVEFLVLNYTSMSLTGIGAIGLPECWAAS